MTMGLNNYLEELVEFSQTMLDNETEKFTETQQQFLGIVQNNALLLAEENVTDLSLEDLSRKSHDLRQYLTTIVGYSALLNSPKLSNHDVLSEKQLTQITTLHNLSRYVHWYLDGWIMFANQIVRPQSGKMLDFGMLNIAGYLQAQADNYICRQHISDIHISKRVPYVYANDLYTKLILRSLFTIALNICNHPAIQISAYTMMKVVRIKIIVLHCGKKIDSLMQLLHTDNIMDIDDEITQRVRVKNLKRIENITIIELAIQIATTLAIKQGGRVKVDNDGDNLVFTLTMPTLVPAKTD